MASNYPNLYLIYLRLTEKQWQTMRIIVATVEQMSPGEVRLVHFQAVN